MTTSVHEPLIDEARNGSIEALERLLESVWPDTFRIAYSIVRDHAAAEDAAQDACAIVYRKIATLQSAAAFRVWLYRIVVREAKRAQIRSTVPENPLIIDSAAGTEAALDVRHALESLSRDLRAVVILHYYAELTSKEIAAVLNATASTVRFRLMIARRKLKPLLEERSGHRTAAQTKEHS